MNKGFIIFLCIFFAVIFLIIIFSYPLEITDDITEEKYYEFQNSFPLGKDVEELKEPHWTHMPITYSYSENCVGPIIKKLEWAFDIITEQTQNKVIFQEIDKDADIKIICFKELNIKSISDDTTIIHGLARFIISGNIIMNASITFWGVDENKSPPSCYTFPNTEIHEILHVFGFGHIENNPYSIMYPYNNNCIAKDNTITLLATGETFKPEDKIDDKIVSCLKRVYSTDENNDSCFGIPFIENELDYF